MFPHTKNPFPYKRKTQTAILAILAVTLTTQTANAAPTFAPQENYKTAENRSSDAVALGDMNNDGKLDAVTSNRDDSISVLTGKGDGTFNTRNETPTSPETDPKTLFLKDVNEDGKQDVIVKASSSLVILMIGNGDGTLQPAKKIVDTTRDFHVADVNNDGHQDIISVNGKNIQTVLGNGDGTFQPEKVSALPNNSSNVTIGDLNNDGKPDAVIHQDHPMGYPYARIAVGTGNGDGTFTTPTTIYTTDAYHHYSLGHIAVADFNNDSKLDVVTANAESNSVSIFTGNGDGTLNPKDDYKSGFMSGYTATGDFDKDGTLDIAVSNGTDPSQLSVLSGTTPRPPLFNRTPSTFSLRSHYNSTLATGDLNNDGYPDIVGGVSARTGGAALGVLINTSKPPPPVPPKLQIDPFQSWGIPALGQIGLKIHIQCPPEAAPCNANLKTIYVANNDKGDFFMTPLTTPPTTYDSIPASTPTWTTKTLWMDRKTVDGLTEVEDCTSGGDCNNTTQLTAYVIGTIQTKDGTYDFNPNTKRTIHKGHNDD